MGNGVCSARVRTGIGTKVRDGCEPPGECWELNLGALEEPGASFQPQYFIYTKGLYYQPQLNMEVQLVIITPACVTQKGLQATISMAHSTDLTTKPSALPFSKVFFPVFYTRPC